MLFGSARRESLLWNLLLNLNQRCAACKLMTFPGALTVSDLITEPQKILGDLLEDIIRLGHDALEDSVVAKWDRNTGVAGAARMKAMDDNKASYPGLRPNEDEIPSGLNESLTDYAYQEASDLSHMVKRPLSSVTDPVTGLAVLPPPYAQVQTMPLPLCS